MGKLPYRCKDVVELYAFRKEEVDRLEKLGKAFERVGIVAEIYYSSHEDLTYATLVVFWPWTFHIEISRFDPKAFKKWHSVKKSKIKNQKSKFRKMD